MTWDASAGKGAHIGWIHLPRNSTLPVYARHSGELEAWLYCPGFIRSRL